MCSFLTFWKLKKIIPDFHFLKDFGCPNSKNKTQNNDQYISLSEVHLSFFLKCVSEWNKLFRYIKKKSQILLFNLIHRLVHLKMHLLKTKLWKSIIFILFSAGFLCQFFVGGVTAGVTNIAGSPLLATTAAWVVSSLADKICG